MIGCGNFGNRRLQALSVIDDAKLVYAVDLDEKKAKTAAAQSGCEYSTDYRRILGKGDIDCAIIATPNNVHANASVYAMSRGKHVLCEKPLASSLREAKQMVQAAEKNSVKLKVGSNLRYFPNVVEAKRILDEGKIGKLIFLRGWIGNSGNHLKGSWYSKPEIMGGGTLLDNGHHLIDLSSLFLGDISHASGYVCTLVHDTLSEDNAAAVLHTDKGTFALIQSSWTEWNGYTYIEVYGHEGSMILDCRQGQNKLTVRGTDDSSQYFDFSNKGPSSYTLEIADFVDAVRNDREIRPTGRDGYRILQLVWQVYRSGGALALRPR